VIATVRGFTEYFEGVRRRTVGFFRALPPERMDWAPQTGEYTAGDIIRHVAACEPMFAGAALGRPWRYAGHEREHGATLEQALAYLDGCHATASGLLAAADDHALSAVVPSLELGARPIKAWRLLMAMTEHEVHHRSQLASYLTWMGVEAPDVFGLGVEDVMRLTAEPAGRPA
jgi:uncharacterized damage-inducible protein DinB